MAPQSLITHHATLALLIRRSRCGLLEQARQAAGRPLVRRHHIDSV
jgi:hypothetical protein